MPKSKQGAGTGRTGPLEQRGKKVQALRAALVEGEQSGASTPFNFDEFIDGKCQGDK